METGEIRLSLDDAERARIRAEEIYRAEIRKELEGKGSEITRSVRFWTLLNSSFALWFLSTVVVTALGAAYAGYQNRYQEEQKRSETERRLRMEIGHRIYHANAGLKIAETNILRGEHYLPASIYALEVRYLNNEFVDDPVDHLDLSVFPEYRQRSFRSLMTELSDVVVDSAGQTDLRDATQTIETFADLGSLRDADSRDTTAQSVSAAESLAAVHNARLLVEKGLLRPRWELKLFPFARTKQTD